MHTNSHKDRHSNLNKSLCTNKSYSILLLLPNQIHMCQAMRTWDLTWRTDLGVSEDGKKLSMMGNDVLMTNTYISALFMFSQHRWMMTLRQSSLLETYLVQSLLRRRRLWPNQSSSLYTPSTGEYIATRWSRKKSGFLNNLLLRSKTYLKKKQHDSSWTPPG